MWLVDFGETEDAQLMLDNIKYFAQVQGISQKRLVLLGVALYIEKIGSSPELIKQVADYLSMPRKNARGNK